MDRKAFETAAETGELVRLEDRSKSNFNDEWLVPIVHPSPQVIGYTGEVSSVPLEELRRALPGMTVRELKTRLDKLDPDRRVVMQTAADEYADIEIDEEVHLDLEARSGPEATGTDAPGDTIRHRRETRAQFSAPATCISIRPNEMDTDRTTGRSELVELTMRHGWIDNARPLKRTALGSVIVVRDYDVEGAEQTETDDDGKPYTIHLVYTHGPHT